MAVFSFHPVTDLGGWRSTFTLQLTWEHNQEEAFVETGTLVRNSDGSYSVFGTWPDNRSLISSQIKIMETVQRPAVDGQPAETYTVDYIGSFDIAGHSNESDDTPEVAPTDDPPTEDSSDELIAARIPTPALRPPAAPTAPRSAASSQNQTDSLAAIVFATGDQ